MTSEPTPELSSVIAWIESRGNPFAMRFEPSVFAGSRFVDHNLLDIIQNCNECDENTARVIASTSWGRFQDMGFNLYNSPRNYRGTIGRFFSSPILQLGTFHDYVSHRMIDYSVNDLAISATKREHFGLLYNGSVNYAANIVASLEHYGVTVK